MATPAAIRILLDNNPPGCEGGALGAACTCLVYLESKENLCLNLKTTGCFAAWAPAN